MDHYAGIDVSLEASSLCVVDASGKIVKEAKLSSEPEALIAKTYRFDHAITASGSGAFSLHSEETPPFA